jgi:hypothetical protein
MPLGDGYKGRFKSGRQREPIMDDRDWLQCRDERIMIPYLSGKASERKARLWLCARCRQVWAWLPDPRSREAVRAAEHFADGQLSRAQLAAAREAAATVPDGWAMGDQTDCAFAAVATTVDRVVFSDLRPAGLYPHPNLEIIRRAGPHLLRDIFGNPFRPITLNPAWLTWNHATVPAMAQRIYDERTFHDLPILADALQDAGCTDPDILAHCRSGGEHVRGCWVVDLILGKS